MVPNLLRLSQLLLCLTLLNGCSLHPRNALLSRMGLTTGTVRWVVVDARTWLYVVDDPRLTAEVFDAVNRPGQDRSKMPADQLMGFSTASGSTVVVSVNSLGDILPSYNSRRLARLLGTMWRSVSVERITLRTDIAWAKVCRGNRVRSVPAGALPALGARTGRFLSMWNPRSLDGCATLDTDELWRLVDRDCSTLEAVLKKPITLTVFVRTGGATWPPDRPSWSGCYRRITVQRVALVKIERATKAAFYDADTRQWYVTNRLRRYDRWNRKPGKLLPSTAEEYAAVLGAAGGVPAGR